MSTVSSMPEGLRAIPDSHFHPRHIKVHVSHDFNFRVLEGNTDWVMIMLLVWRFTADETASAGGDLTERVDPAPTETGKVTAVPTDP